MLQAEVTKQTAPTAPTELAGFAELVARGVRRGVATSDVSVWQLSNLTGRLGEMAGDHDSAALTLAFRLVLEAQQRGEPVAWITEKGSTFFPPDVADTGVDLDQLAVVRLSEARQLPRAADHLLRSGAFGLLVLDVGARGWMPIHIQTRLVGLAKKHETALLCLTEKASHRPSLGSLVSIRAQAARTSGEEGRFRCEAHVLKDKRRGPGRKHAEVFHGPAGVR